MKVKSEGYVVVASRLKGFYDLAINLCESILDYHPKAKIALFTEERFVDHRASICDQIVYCDDHYRAKLWAMARSPYDLTFYIDADMECQHEDISTVFDQIQDNDMVFTSITEENEKSFVFKYFTPKAKRERNQKHSFYYHGAVCLYDNTNLLVKEFMHDWQQKYYAARNKHEWWPLDENGNRDFVNFPAQLYVWDQFPLWWLTTEEEKYKSLKIGVFEDYMRWNYSCNYPELNIFCKKDPILIHYSGSKDDIICRK